MSCPERAHLFPHYLIIFLLRVDLHGFNFSEHTSLFTIILLRFLHCLLYPQKCLPEIKPHTSPLQPQFTEGRCGGGSSRKTQFPLSSSELQNYPRCNDLDFIVYCLLALQIRSALGSLKWKVLDKYFSFLLFLSLRLFTNRSVKIQNKFF